MIERLLAGAALLWAGLVGVRRPKRPAEPTRPTAPEQPAAVEPPPFVPPRPRPRADESERVRPGPEPEGGPPGYTAKREWTRAELWALMEDAAARWRVPTELLAGIAQTESRFRPSARGAAGEFGAFQLMPATTAVLLRREGWPDFPTQSAAIDFGSAAMLAAALLAELEAHLGLTSKPFPQSHSRVIQGYNLGEPKFKNGLRAPEYLARVVGHIDGAAGELLALVPVERVFG